MKSSIKPPNNPEIKLNAQIGGKCHFCEEHIPDFNKPVCDKCMSALKDLVLEKRKLNDETNRNNEA